MRPAWETGHIPKLIDSHVLAFDQEIHERKM